MLVVPEVDDDMNASSSSIENTQPTNQSEIIDESLTSSPPPSTLTSTAPAEKDESTPTESQPPTTRQHTSRLSQFQRNTIHLCDQISEHV